MWHQFLINKISCIFILDITADFWTSGNDIGITNNYTWRPPGKLILLKARVKVRQIMLQVTK